MKTDPSWGRVGEKAPREEEEGKLHMEWDEKRRRRGRGRIIGKSQWDRRKVEPPRSGRGGYVDGSSLF